MIYNPRMAQNISLKYRFYPTDDQKVLLSKTFGCVRFVYNHILDWRSKEYSINGIKINYCASTKKLTEIKHVEQYSWLNEVSAVALQWSLRNQDKAFSNFFAKRAKYPIFKKKNNDQSFTLHGTAFSIKKDGNVYICKSKEPLNIKWSRKLRGTPSSITISKDCADRYFISFCTTDDIKPLPKINKTIGIDLGLTHFAITSDGVKIKPIKALVAKQKKLKKAQQQLSRKVKGSANRNKARLKVAKIHVKISDTRKDFLHKLSTKLINENQVICLEDLNVAGMVRNHKLAKAISDASWSEFVRQLEYKAKWYDRTITKCSPWYPSSQICSSCGILTGKKALNIRSWTCPSCGIEHDRDINAAKNIHTAGLAEIYA